MHPFPPHRDRERERGTKRKRQRPTDKRIMWETHYWLYSQHWSWKETTKQNICMAYLIVHKTLRLVPGRQGMNHQDQIARQVWIIRIKYFVIPKKNIKEIPSCTFHYSTFFISHSKVKTDAECDNMIKANRENNELRVKKMDEQNHSCSCGLEIWELTGSLHKARVDSQSSTSIPRRKKSRGFLAGETVTTWAGKTAT